MSQAIIDFCQGLQTTLLGVEERLLKAKASADAAGAAIGKETQEHIETASRQLAQFRDKAAQMAAALRAELPENPGELKERLNQCGLEAQVALRHAAVFLAETTSKGAEGASALLKQAAERAHATADHLRADTSVTVREAKPTQASPAAN